MSPNQIILTEDKDFGEWVFSHKTKDLSVLFLRYKFFETNKIIGVLLDLISTKQDGLFHHFTTVTVNKIRMKGI